MSHAVQQPGRSIVFRCLLRPLSLLTRLWRAGVARRPGPLIVFRCFFGSLPPDPGGRAVVLPKTVRRSSLDLPLEGGGRLRIGAIG